MTNYDMISPEDGLNEALRRVREVEEERDSLAAQNLALHQQLDAEIAEKLNVESDKDFWCGQVVAWRKAMEHVLAMFREECPTEYPAMEKIVKELTNAQR